MMKKPVRIAIILAGCILAAAVLFVAVSCIIYPPEYVYRCIINQEGKTTDYRFFPERVIKKGPVPYQYGNRPDSAMNTLAVQYTQKGQLRDAQLDSLASLSDTTSLIVIHKDEVVYQAYFNGSDAGSVNTSFSMAKSVASLLIGMAIDDGFIKSETQPISDFIPEFNGTAFADITIRDLLLMRSKIAYQTGGLWFSDNAKTYYYPDLRELALKHMRADQQYDGRFLYNNYHPLLLGIILERSTGVSVCEYFRQKIWDKIGAQYDASWSLDSEKSGFEKMESGLNFRSIDFAKIGSMLLHRGKWNGQSFVSESWLDRSVIATEPLNEGGLGYQYMWYSFANEKGGYDYFAHGSHGQYLYVSPENDTVIVRTGTEEGPVDTWPVVFYQMAMHAGNL